jgi:hypothetical protein
VWLPGCTVPAAMGDVLRQETKLEPQYVRITALCTSLVGAPSTCACPKGTQSPGHTGTAQLRGDIPPVVPLPVAPRRAGVGWMHPARAQLTAWRD